MTRPIPLPLLALGALALTGLALAAPAAAGDPGVAQPAAPPPELAAVGERLAAGDLDGAIAALEAASSGGKAPPQASALLGALYLEAARPAEALAVLAPLAAGEDADPQLLFHAAQAALASGLAAEAESYLVRSVAKVPASLAAVALAELRTEQGRHADAALLLGPLIEGPDAETLAARDPGSAAEVAVRSARAHRASGSADAAVASLERAVRLAPQRRDAWQLLGDTLVDLGRLDEARQALTRAHEMAEDERAAALEAERRREEAQAKVAAAHAHYGGGRLEAALEALREAIALAPDDPASRLLEVRLLTTLRRPSEAIARADELLGLTPGDPDALHLRATALLGLGEVAAAEADLRRALAASPEHLGALNGLAIALMGQERWGEAEEVLAGLLARWPGDRVAARNLALIRARRSS